MPSVEKTLFYGAPALAIFWALTYAYYSRAKAATWRTLAQRLEAAFDQEAAEAKRERAALLAEARAAREQSFKLLEAHLVGDQREREALIQALEKMTLKGNA